MIDPVRTGEVNRTVGGPGVKLGSKLNELIDAVNAIDFDRIERLEVALVDLRARVEALEFGEDDDG